MNARPDLAHQFINFMLEGRNSAALTNITGSGNITLAAASSLEKDLRASLKNGANIEAAKAVGASIAARLKEKGITAVVFDRNGYVYHGRVKALADSAREAGLQF